MADEKRLDRMEGKIDDVKESIATINVTLAAQHESLKEHIKRTSLLEKEFKPIRNHVIMVHGVMKFLAATAILSGIIEGIFVMLEYFKK